MKKTRAERDVSQSLTAHNVCLWLCVIDYIIPSIWTHAWVSVSVTLTNEMNRLIVVAQIIKLAHLAVDIQFIE